MNPGLKKGSSALISLVLCVSALFAQQANSIPKGTIEGVVLNDATGEPVSGAEVRLGVFVTRPSTPPPPGVTEATPDVPNVPVLTTGPDGKFSFKDINPETYRVIAAANGFIRLEYGQKEPYGAGRPVYVSAGQQVQGVIIRLLGTGAVSGRILQDSGQPALGATVWIIRPNYSSQGRRLEPVGKTSADDRGDFRAYGLTPGRYYIVAGTDPTAMRQIGTTVGEPNAGRVDSYAITYYPAAADPEHATMVDIKAAADANVDMRVAKRKEYHIRGRVLDAATGRPPERVQLDLVFQGFQGSAAPMPVANNYDAATGNFDFANIAPGDYTVRLRIPATPSNPNDPGAVQAALTAQLRAPVVQLAAVAVSTADVEGLSLTLSPGVTVPARLVVEGQPETDLSRFAIRMGLVAYSQRFAGVGPFQTLSISPDGTLSLPNIQEGANVFQVFSLGSGFYIKSVKYGGVDVLSKAFRIVSKPDTLEVTVRRGIGTLSGSVIDSRNDRVAGIPVALLPDQRDLTDNYRIGLTRQDGTFSIDNIPPGRYKVFSWELAEQRAYFDPDFVNRYELQGRSVTVQEGTNSAADNVKLIVATP